MGLVTIVTGGSRGIGAATVAALTTAGHAVAIGYARDRDAADDVARATGGFPVEVDVTDEDDVDHLFPTVAAELGPVTGLVNNAGVTSPMGRLADAKVEDLRRVVDVNLIGVLLCARRAAAVLPRGGAIVNVSSSASTIGSPNTYVHYAATKAAVDALTVGLAKELAPDGIRVNAVSPGIIGTGIPRVVGGRRSSGQAGGHDPTGAPGGGRGDRRGHRLAHVAGRVLRQRGRGAPGGPPGGRPTCSPRPSGFPGPAAPADPQKSEGRRGRQAGQADRLRGGGKRAGRAGGAGRAPLANSDVRDRVPQPSTSCGLREAGPTYSADGRTSLFSFFCSTMCALQPAVRAQVNIEVNMCAGTSA